MYGKSYASESCVVKFVNIVKCSVGLWEVFHLTNFLLHKKTFHFFNARINTFLSVITWSHKQIEKV